MKTNMCKEINFKLIHIWEDEWINEKDSIKEKNKKCHLQKKKLSYIIIKLVEKYK